MKKVITFGRDPGNDVIIDNDYVSRVHLKITVYDPEKISITDYNSHNGTYVNGKRINSETYIHPQDIVKIGDTELSWTKYIHEDVKQAKSSNLKQPKTSISWREILGIITAIVSLLMMVFYMLKSLK